MDSLQQILVGASPPLCSSHHWSHRLLGHTDRGQEVLEPRCPPPSRDVLQGTGFWDIPKGCRFGASFPWQQEGFGLSWRKPLVPGRIFTLREAEFGSRSQARNGKLQSRSREEGRKTWIQSHLPHLQEGNWEDAVWKGTSQNNGNLTLSKTAGHRRT